MFDFLFYTIPHSGTHFIFELFKQLDIPRYGYSGTFINNNPHEKTSRRPHYFHIHAKEKVTYHPIHAELLKNYKIISIVRHPHDNYISHLSRNLSIDDCVEAWNIFFDVFERNDMFVIDMNTPDKHKSLIDAFKYVNIYSQIDKNVVNKYVETWKPQNSWDTEIKEEYLKTKRLPNEEDYDILCPAVEWYTKMFPYNK
jgi:hypothetical protein